MDPIVIRRAATLLAGAMCCSVFAGCSIVGLDGDGGDLDDARARWEATRPASYQYAIVRQCFCGPDARGPVRITVSASNIVSQVYVDDGRPVVGDATTWFPSVDGLFDVLQDAIDREAHTIDVTYDPTTGVPLDFWIDYAEFTADEELGFEVTEAVQPIG